MSQLHVAPHARDELRVVSGTLAYQTAHSDKWEYLPLNYSRVSGESIRKVVLSGGCLCVLQFARPPIQDNQGMAVKSSKRTIKFDIRRISNSWAREYDLEKEGKGLVSMKELVFGCTHPPTGFEAQNYETNAKNLKT